MSTESAPVDDSPAFERQLARRRRRPVTAGWLAIVWAIVMWVIAAGGLFFVPVSRARMHCYDLGFAERWYVLWGHPSLHALAILLIMTVLLGLLVVCRVAIDRARHGDAG